MEIPWVWREEGCTFALGCTDVPDLGLTPKRQKQDCQHLTHLLTLLQQPVSLGMSAGWSLPCLQHAVDITMLA